MFIDLLFIQHHFYFIFSAPINKNKTALRTKNNIISNFRRQFASILIYVSPTEQVSLHFSDSWELYILYLGNIYSLSAS